MNKVTVVVTTYNGERFLAQQLHSLLMQTLMPAEIIICDDGSTDNTNQLIESFLPNPIIRYIRNESQLGVIQNFKKAVALATPGNYIALCDQDDIWLPQKLEKSAEALAAIEQAGKPAMIYSDLTLIDTEGNLLNSSVNNETGQDKYRHCFETLLFGNFVTGCTVLMNTEMKHYFATIPNNAHYQHDAWIALVAFTMGNISMLSQPYIQYRKHDQNVTFSKHNKKNRIQRLANHLVSLFTTNDFLEEQIELVKAFYHQYRQQITPIQQKTIESFLQLEHSNYLKKKTAFEKAFKNHWLKRF